MNRIACVIPTYNGREDLRRLLDSLQYQSLETDVIVVDSSSSDGTYELAKKYSNNVTRIPSTEFNHGGTRQLMIDRNPNYDIYIFLTQDAYLEDSKALLKIVSPFSDTKVGAVCGRQLPHVDANDLARHARAFNYPNDSQLKTLKDASNLGLKTAFMSNSFAAYRRNAIMECGGFPRHVIFAEDMYIAAKMLLAGWKISYEGTASCRHSHNYTLIQELQRYFDMGVFHARESWIQEYFGKAGGEGIKYVKSELKFLGLSKFYLWPTSLIRNAFKLTGYKLGKLERYLPTRVKIFFSMYKRYWNTHHPE